MKKIVLSIGASLLLAGCGFQNLGPLEDKTTQLRDDNHQLKLKIQELNSEVTSEKEKVKALEKDKNNKKQAASNNQEAKFLKASAEYYQQITKAIDMYNKLDLTKTSSKVKKENLDKLDEIDNKLSEAYSNYQSSVNEHDLNSDNKKKHKVIKSLNKDLTSALDDIKSGYQSKDTKKLKKGQSELGQVNLSDNQTTK